MTNQTSRYQRAMTGMRKYALILSAFGLGTTPLTTGCNADSVQEETTASVSFSIKSADVLQETGAQGRLSGLSTRSALAYSFTDVNRIRVDVKEKLSGNAILVNFDLLLEEGEWKGKIPSLPKNKELTFSARAFNVTGADTTLLFKGDTDQTLTASGQTVVLALADANDGRTITLPRIKRISIPSAFSSDQNGNISFTVEANSAEALKYTLEPDARGGSFFPPNGTITLAATAGTFVSQYAPPVVATDTEFENKVTVTNSTGHSVTTTFKTKVKPPGRGDAVKDSILNVIFAPVINSLSASRKVGTGEVSFGVTVADETPAGLTYLWNFVPSGTYDPTPGFINTTLNPAILQNYTMALQGTVEVQVTDSNGKKTSLKYPLTPNQFPDNPSQEGPASGLNSIRAGDNHTCALYNDGTMSCWGLGSAGQLGYGSSANVGDDPARLPRIAGKVPVVGLGSKLAVGGNHTCAVLEDGYVSCWGENEFGQLGYNTTFDVGDTEAISSYGYVNLGGAAIKIAAGGSHTCAMMETGGVRCWGRNNYGQLGYSHTKNLGDDEQIWKEGEVVVGSPVKDLALGAEHTCALLQNGSVRCWGRNDFGQLGVSSTTVYGNTSATAASMAPLVNLSGATVLQLSAGAQHTCALLSTGGIRCWGRNDVGQLGNGTSGNGTNIGDNEPPGLDITLGGKALQVAAGQSHTCALLESGAIKCWGLASSGQLGYGNTTQLTAPPTTATVDLDGATAFQVSTGANHTCALLSTGKARCWGSTTNGQLGYGYKTVVGGANNNVGDNESPAAAGDVPL